MRKFGKQPRLLGGLFGAASLAVACVVAEQPSIGGFNTFSDGTTPTPTIDAASSACDGSAPTSGEGGACAVSFVNSVVPILNSNCFGCHAGSSNPQIVFPSQPSGPGFYEALTKAKFLGQTGLYLNACDPAKSGLGCNLGASNCTPAGVTMPPNSPLLEADKQVIAAWLACGAPNN